jgi:Domain of Unknown Function with PDB structure (DUF3857)/Transglutaminase-like superfamily
MKLILAAIFLFVAGGPVRAADAVPDWIREAVAHPVPQYPVKVTFVKLFQEEVVDVDAGGKEVMRERGAIKILQPGGESIRAYRTYDTKNGRIRDFQGWLVPPSGKPVPYAKNRIVDVALVRENAYDEARVKVLDCGSAAPGSVFAWEITEEEKTLFTQDAYEFQGRMPVVVSRFVLTLPSGWEVKATMLNRDQVEPAVSGRTHTWELRDLPWIEPEEHSPSLSSLAPRLAVSYFPPAGSSGGLQGLANWTAVSTWLSTLVDPAAEVTDAIRAKAIQLTADASGELDKIRAIAEFTQKTNYVEVLLNVTRGGGYKPRPAEETLAKNYGDCKDKATLMRALLKAVGIEAFLATISADDPAFVRLEWASPMQFNHAIVAVRVSDVVKVPTVLESPSLGRLLLFDPTDPITPPGDLPMNEQGGYALVIAGARGGLLKIPMLAASARRIESTVEGTIDAGGRLAAAMERRYFGQSGVALQGFERREGEAELKKFFERGFARSVPSANVSRVTMEKRLGEDSLSVSIDLAAEKFGQIMQGSLLVVRPGLLASGGEYGFSSKQRSAPIKLLADLRHASIKIKLPSGFKLDEAPAPARIESPYGTIEARWSEKSGEIVMEETLEIYNMVAPASEYAKVRDFFANVSGVHGAPIVLVKK